MKKDGEEVLQGTSLGLERLHKKVIGTDIQGMHTYTDNNPNYSTIILP